MTHQSPVSRHRKHITGILQPPRHHNHAAPVGVTSPPCPCSRVLSSPVPFPCGSRGRPSRQNRARQNSAARDPKGPREGALGGARVTAAHPHELPANGIPKDNASCRGGATCHACRLVPGRIFPPRRARPQPSSKAATECPTGRGSTTTRTATGAIHRCSPNDHRWLAPTSRARSRRGRAKRQRTGSRIR